ncbi:MAG: hypothetical protein PWR08_1731 [Thermoanaerobacterium sp.]|uniref:Uncharacterized protein n=2 Tax=Thermoanaerobacterium TaxID=28895 RepID=A0ABS4NAU7_9THEO|nr:hypothetical protein [Thermoanaerobacterium butyriciformans]MDN5317606.1 hypothetical protein [Thermoanaerobacterium sp.]
MRKGVCDMEQKRRLNVRVDVDSPIWHERNMSETTRKALDFYYTFWHTTNSVLDKIEYILKEIERKDKDESGNKG